jgi:hypothetical protein
MEGSYDNLTYFRKVNNMYIVSNAPSVIPSKIINYFNSFKYTRRILVFCQVHLIEWFNENKISSVQDYIIITSADIKQIKFNVWKEVVKSNMPAFIRNEYFDNKFDLMLDRALVHVNAVFNTHYVKTKNSIIILK